MNSPMAYFWITIFIQISAIGLAFLFRTKYAARYRFPAWSALVAALLPVLLTFISYFVLKDEATVGGQDVVTTAVCLLFIAGAIYYLTYRLDITDDTIYIRSMLGKKRLPLQSITSATIQVRTRGSNWLELKFSDGSKVQMSEILEPFTLLCITIATSLKAQGKELTTVNARGEVSPFPYLM
jgi:hypothetical protein